MFTNILRKIKSEKKILFKKLKENSWYKSTWNVLLVTTQYLYKLTWNYCTTLCIICAHAKLVTIWSLEIDIFMWVYDLGLLSISLNLLFTSAKTHQHLAEMLKMTFEDFLQLTLTNFLAPDNFVWCAVASVWWFISGIYWLGQQCTKDL